MTIDKTEFENAKIYLRFHLNNDFFSYVFYDLQHWVHQNSHECEVVNRIQNPQLLCKIVDSLKINYHLQRGVELKCQYGRTELMTMFGSHIVNMMYQYPDLYWQLSPVMIPRDLNDLLCLVENFEIKDLK